MSSSAISSELQKTVDHLLSGEVWSELAIMVEDKGPKSHTSDMETRPSDSTLPGNAGCRKIGAGNLD